MLFSGFTPSQVARAAIAHFILGVTEARVGASTVRNEANNCSAALCEAALIASLLLFNAILGKEHIINAVRTDRFDVVNGRSRSMTTMLRILIKMLWCSSIRRSPFRQLL